MSCRINRTAEWTTRLLHELQYWDTASFVTLTYDDDHLPNNGTLVKHDLVTWIKLVRYHLSGRSIKYYACGEYGEETHRAHYHAIMYGVSQLDKLLLYNCWAKCNYERLHVGTVTHDSIQYVCGYVRKKLTGNMSHNAYIAKGLLPPFAICSQGLGLDWAIKNQKMLKQKLHLTGNGGVTIPIPRYYRKKLEIKLVDEDHPQPEMGAPGSNHKQTELNTIARMALQGQRTNKL